MRSSPCLRAVAIGALSLLAACASEKPCRSFPQCDIRNPGCQADVWREAQCTRDAARSEMPPVRVIDVAALRTELEARVASDVPEPDAVHLDRALELLGLVPEGASLAASQIDAQVASLAAYYDTEDGSITIVDRGAMDTAEDVVTLHHEMVHAVQDRAHDLGSLLASAATTDEEIAISMLVEGEATTHMLHYYAIASGLRDHEIDWATAYGRLLEGTRTITPQTHRWYLGRSALLYPLGGRSVTHGWLADRASPAERFDAPPVSAIAFFHDPFARERGVLVPSAALCETAPPAGARAVHDDRFGPSLLYAFAAEPGTETFTFDLARAWRQDRVTVVASGDDLHTAVLWRIELASATDAVTFGAGPSWWSTAPLHAWARFEDEIVLLASDDPSLLESWADAALAACP